MSAAGTDNCTVTLNAAAPNTGFAVGLASNNSIVTLPASVNVLAGASTAVFSAIAGTITSAQTVILSANAGGVTESFALQLGSGTPTLAISTNSLAFGNASVYSPVTQSITLTSTGTAPVTVDSANLSGSGFTVSGAAFPLTLAPNQTATLTVQFDPAQSGAASGSITLVSNSSSGLISTISLSGTGVPVLTGLTCNSASLTGAGNDACTITLNAAAASGGFTVNLASSSSSITVPATVTVGSKATSATFSATVSAASSATAVTLTASAGSATQSFVVQLGTASPGLTINATTIAFGEVSLNSPATQSVSLTSTGSEPVTVSLATVVGAGFTISGASFPLTLNPNQTATLNVEFDPTTAGDVTGTLTIVSTALSNPTDIITLTGTGDSTAYEVNLSWNPPISSTDPIAGYNVYRSPSGGSSYQQINTSVLTQTAFVDTAVEVGQTYDYIVESVDSTGNSSAPSNMASVTTP
jgi:hypothetical protein